MNEWGRAARVAESNEIGAGFNPKRGSTLVLILRADPYFSGFTADVELDEVEVSSPNLPFSRQRRCGYGTLGMAELVLVVEDEAHVRELVSYTLQGAGYRVVAVDDGESALGEVSRAMPSLIVLDVRLPGIDGWEVCRRVREQSNVPILILTALTEDESLVRGLRLGADDHWASRFPRSYSRPASKPSCVGPATPRCSNAFFCTACPSI